MVEKHAWPEPLVLTLDERSLRGFTKLQRANGELQVFVPYTCRELTQAALAKAGELTRNLGARITLFTVHVAPFPLPLDRPDVPSSFLERKLAGVARAAAMQADIRIAIARDAELGCQQILPPHSLVVMATRRRWWPTAEEKLARALAQAGHSVALLGV